MHHRSWWNRSYCLTLFMYILEKGDVQIDTQISIPLILKLYVLKSILKYKISVLSPPPALAKHSCCANHPSRVGVHPPVSIILQVASASDRIADTSLNITRYQIRKTISGIKHHYWRKHAEQLLVFQAEMWSLCTAGMLNCLLGVPSSPHVTRCLSIQGDLSSWVTLTST